MQTVQFNHWEYRPSNCDAVAAAAAAADCDAGDVDDGQTLDALECRPRRLDKACRPSDSMIKSTDCQIVVLLLLLPLLLMAMLVVMMMPTAPTLVLSSLWLSCRGTFACTIFIIVIIIIYTSPSGSTVPHAPYSVHLVEACLPCS